MIDLGLSKLVLIGVVALVVIGPEKLPRVARMAGALFGRAQRYINDVKSEVSREMALDDLHRIGTEMQATAHDIRDSIAHNMTQEETADASAQMSLSAEQPAAKARNFRRNKTGRAALIVAKSGKRRHSRIGVLSSAARATRRRAGGNAPASFWSIADDGTA